MDGLLAVDPGGVNRQDGVEPNDEPAGDACLGSGSDALPPRRENTLRRDADGGDDPGVLSAVEAAAVEDITSAPGPSSLDRPWPPSQAATWPSRSSSGKSRAMAAYSRAKHS